MNSNPKKVDIQNMAFDALKIIEKNNITQLIVMDRMSMLGYYTYTIS